MDSTDLKYYIKSLRQKEIVVTMAAGFTLVFALACFLIFWFWPRPAHQPVAQLESTPELVTTLPESVSYKKEGSALIPDGLPVTYEVQRGDSSWKIAEAFYGSGFNYRDIESANNLRANQALEIGQRLLIPQVAAKGIVAEVETPDYGTQPSSPLPSASPVSSPTPAPVETAAPAPVSREYVVVAGDSLWKISQQRLGSGYKWPQLYSANRKVVGRNPDYIQVGLKLQLPE